ncbi:MAG: phosphoglycerate dehydrogenase [Armatimonadota bacterium]|nr:phosphoglycerate dehydrogenase [Armatimonadota bacterium]
MEKFRVLVTAQAAIRTAKDDLDRLRAAGAEVVVGPRIGAHPEEELVKILPGVDAVWAAADAYTAAAFAAADRLKIVARWGIGIDSIDLAAATRAGVLVTNTPGMTTESVADFAFGLMLDAARRLTEAHNTLRAGRWEQLWGVDVWRKTLGVVGFGNIGRAMARRARGFEMTVLAFDPYVDPTAAEALGVEMVSLEVLLERSDFVTLHASLTPETCGLIGEKEIRRMKPGAFLINCGRGALVDTRALATALSEGRLAGAAVDVYEVEPPPPDHPLLALPNCLTLPHCASSSYDGGRAINRLCADQILAAMRGEVPPHVCNPEVLTHARALV